MAMRKVRCVSPHGGAHHGTDGRGQPVGAAYNGPRQLPPNPGGYVDNAVLGRVAVGAQVDAPEAPAFIADGFHFVNDAGEADVCAATGDDCWCGQHRGVPVPDTTAATTLAETGSEGGAE